MFFGRQACLVAHSLGTTAASWMLHHPTACLRVASTVLLDPVTFLLCDPTVATSFVYKVLPGPAVRAVGVSSLATTPHHICFPAVAGPNHVHGPAHALFPES